uniref:NADH-ubiquinone oxidoreductase chain 4L n=1 Tax=Calliotropis micraulax TaxID=2496602 RepID=A0A6B7FLW9_9VEST|nr:NADH dehydrogenase subunit 4L [Calliotropis micraulax]
MSVSFLYVFSSLGVFTSIVTLCFQYKHLLNALLSLEAMMLNLFVLLFCVSSGFSFEGHMCLVLITIGACEASLGLAVLVSLIRTHGNDYVNSFSTHKC